MILKLVIGISLAKFRDSDMLHGWLITNSTFMEDLIKKPQLFLLNRF